MADTETKVNKTRKVKPPVVLAFDRITALDLDQQSELCDMLKSMKPRTARFLAGELTTD